MRSIIRVLRTDAEIIWLKLKMKAMKKFISLGLGVQSTALYYMSSLGELPRVDAAIFADLGREKIETMKYMENLRE